MLKKFPWDKINGTKNVLFFLSRILTHHSFTFNLRFFYELKHKVRLSKTVWDFAFSILFCFSYYFLFCFYILIQQNAWTHGLFDFNSFMTEAVSYRNQSIDLLLKSLDWFLYDNGLRHERVKTL